MDKQDRWKINYRKRTKVFVNAMMEYLDDVAKEDKEPPKNVIIKK